MGFADLKTEVTMDCILLFGPNGFTVNEIVVSPIVLPDSVCFWFVYPMSFIWIDGLGKPQLCLFVWSNICSLLLDVMWFFCVLPVSAFGEIESFCLLINKYKNARYLRKPWNKPLRFSCGITIKHISFFDL